MTKPEHAAWRRQVEEPTRTAEGGSIGAEVFSHPSFAQISAHRTNGGKVLYGSDFLHGGYISIRIAASTLRRSLSTDWPHAKSVPMIEVCLSEAQWAHFVSSLNVGEGTQCTLQSFGGKDVPGLPDPVDRRDQFGREVAANAREAIEHLSKVRGLLEASGLSAKKQQEMLRELNMAEREITSSQKFVADQFGEHMESTVQSAKIEVAAYIGGAVRQLGINALQLQQAGVAPLTLDLPDARPDQPAPEST